MDGWVDRGFHACWELDSPQESLAASFPAKKPSSQLHSLTTSLELIQLQAPTELDGMTNHLKAMLSSPQFRLWVSLSDVPCLLGLG